jgi:hypothetical protein
VCVSKRARVIKQRTLLLKRRDNRFGATLNIFFLSVFPLLAADDAKFLHIENDDDNDSSISDDDDENDENDDSSSVCLSPKRRRFWW